MTTTGTASGLRWIRDFTEGSRDMRDLLGGKGANLAEMVRVLGPARVPPGFTVTTEACTEYRAQNGRLGPELQEEIAAAVAALERITGKVLGDAHDPLLVSVRSGARESMPGMMDTVLNLGLNDVSVNGLAQRTGSERFAWDCYRRFVQMYGNVVLGIDGGRFETAIAHAKNGSNVSDDRDLSAPTLRALVADFKSTTSVPADPVTQLHAAVGAVFDSWTSRRATTYRQLNGIPDDWGTAVTVQQMVFGNRGAESGSGVAFSRDEVTGAPQPSGDFLVNAQGEDVVSGVRTPQDLEHMRKWLPGVHGELLGVLTLLEQHYGDMQDVEFTVEEGRLFLLQTRAAKRPAQAAVRFAVDAVAEGLLDRSAALLTIPASTVETLLHPTFDPSREYVVLATGIAASPGAAKGEVVFTSEDAIARQEEGREVILARPFTEAEDVAGFHASRGVLTSEGGKASHAALVARGMGVPAVTGAGSLDIDVERQQIRVDGVVVLRAGDRVAIDGTAGTVTVDDVALLEPAMSETLTTVLAWADDVRRLRVRANADTPADAAKARELGAEGIGLCRTEHMFLGVRQPLMAEVVLAESDEARDRAVAQLLPLQQADFEAIFEVMAGLPVTIRLLDPPLHEFLPRPESMPPGPRRDRALALQEANPMLGTRGVRLGLLHRGLYAMQVEAIAAAMIGCRARGLDWPTVEIMVPLVAYERELELGRLIVDDAMSRLGVDPDRYTVGTMIELPRACLQADRIAQRADFFSFGTNDLTQTTIGFSRDDIEGRILKQYLSDRVIDRSPFETLDTPGVGQLLRMGAWLGRSAKPQLKLGVCGEHAGDPDSIEFLHSSGVDYLSCSPYRLPVARLAAAQAALRAPTSR